jgi:hypothetical protein
VFENKPPFFNDHYFSLVNGGMTKLEWACKILFIFGPCSIISHNPILVVVTICMFSIYGIHEDGLKV